MTAYFAPVFGGRPMASAARAVEDRLIDQYRRSDKWTEIDEDQVPEPVIRRHNARLAQEAMEARTTTPAAVARRLRSHGWKVYHRSKSNGRVKSYYLERNGQRVRVSDHHLGTTVYGEPQYGGHPDAQAIISLGDTLEDTIDRLYETLDAE